MNAKYFPRNPPGTVVTGKDTDAEIKAKQGVTDFIIK